MSEDWKLEGECEYCHVMTDNYCKRSAEGGLYIFYCANDCTKEQAGEEE